MTVVGFFGKTGRGLAVGAILAAIGLTTAPRPADAGGWGGGGISPGAAVGLGLGAFALGSVLSRPYYNPYYYPYGYYGYYPAAPAYYPPAAYYPYYPPPTPAYSSGPSYTPQPTYTSPAGRSGGNIARQLNQQELNQLQ
jgi:hypothetical protein